MWLLQENNHVGGPLKTPQNDYILIRSMWALPISKERNIIMVREAGTGWCMRLGDIKVPKRKAGIPGTDILERARNRQ